MKYGRHQIDKAGQIILTSTKKEDVILSIEKVNEWRTLHLIALDELQKVIIPILKGHPLIKCVS
jgi:putative GTP pyrophosphokinase